MNITKITTESHVFPDDLEARHRETSGAISRMDGSIREPNKDVAIYYREAKGGFSRIHGTTIMTPQEISDYGFTCDGAPWVNPPEWSFVDEQSLVECLRQFVNSEYANFGSGEMLFCSAMRNLIDNGEMFRDIPVEEHPNFFVFIEAGAPGAENHAGLHMYRVEPTA